jgi:hypothetical protein
MNRRRYEKSSGNVFKDLGLPDAEEHLVRRNSFGRSIGS